MWSVVVKWPPGVRMRGCIPGAGRWWSCRNGVQCGLPPCLCSGETLVPPETPTPVLRRSLGGLETLAPSSWWVQGRPGLRRWEAAPWGPLPDPSLSVVFPAQLFPGRPPVRKLLETLQEWLASLPLDRIPYDAVLDLVNNKMRVRQPLR